MLASTNGSPDELESGIPSARAPIIGWIAVAVLLLGCAPSAPPAEGGPDEPLPPAPWASSGIPVSQVPPVYVEEWGDAENREACALIAPVALGGGTGATPRAATFSGGWAVAYDLPATRSAFGVAGTGTTPDSDTYDEWPHRILWSDGSSAGYGLEGGTGPNHLAYLRIDGQACLYNIWSRLGQEHLEFLLGQLRFVVPASG